MSVSHACHTFQRQVQIDLHGTEPVHCLHKPPSFLCIPDWILLPQLQQRVSALATDLHALQLTVSGARAAAVEGSSAGQQLRQQLASMQEQVARCVPLLPGFGSCPAALFSVFTPDMSVLHICQIAKSASRLTSCSKISHATILTDSLWSIS